MDRPSKQERKRLRRNYEESEKQAHYASVVVGPLATLEDSPPKAIVREARANRVNLESIHISGHHFFLRPRGSTGEFGCDIYYGVVTEELSADFVNLDDLRENPTPIPLGETCIGLSAQVNLHPVNQFVLLTALRVLGRKTQGTLIDIGRNFIMDDWLAWSLDYMEKDMFEVQQVYDPEPPDWQCLVSEFPDLRRRRFWFF